MTNEDAFFPKPRALEIYAITTWGCNLRCPYCFVLQNLKGDGKESQLIDVDKVVQFVFDHIERYDTKTVFMLLVGGEPLRALATCQQYMDVLDRVAEKYPDIDIHRSMTTNLSSHELREYDLELMRRLDYFQVSFDGLEHDKWRKKLRTEGDYNVTQRLVKNLMMINQAGLTDKVRIQSTLQEYNDEEVEIFIKMMIMLGWKAENVLIGRPRNTKHYSKGITQSFLQNMKPCCVWRYMSHFTIDDQGIHTNYFKPDETLIGPIDTPIDKIEEYYREYIKTKMPSYSDPKCRSCPALKICWGGCYGSIESQVQPSLHCDQPRMIELSEKWKQSPSGS